MKDIEQELGITRPTLLRRINRAGIPLYRKAGGGQRRYVKRSDLEQLFVEEFVQIENANIVS